MTLPRRLRRSADSSRYLAIRPFVQGGNHSMEIGRERMQALRSVSLRFSAYLCVLCVYGCFNAEVAEVRREPQRKTESKKLLTKMHKGTNRPWLVFSCAFSASVVASVRLRPRRH